MTPATAPVTIPSPEPDDSEDIVSALQTAELLWTRGDPEEALRWLRRAAETAGDAGNDLRAAAIARVAADLKTLPPGAPSRPPPPPNHLRAASNGRTAVYASPQDQVSNPAPLHSQPPSQVRPADATPVSQHQLPNFQANAQPETTAFSRNALHVYVLRENRQGERLDVRILREGEELPEGAEMALLVPLAGQTPVI